MVSRGEIWLANLNPSKRDNEVAKIRPVLIFQNDDINHSEYPTTIIIPFSTSLIDDAEPIRMRLQKRDDLKHDSDLIVTQIRAIDNNRLMRKLSSLSPKEMQKVNELFDEIAGK